jgi:serine/threonine-protein kinase
MRRAMMLGDDVLPALPPSPIGMSRGQWKHWAREQRRLAREMARGAIASAAGQVDERVVRWFSIENRVHRFRRRLVGTLVFVPALFAINFVMQGFPWFIFPSVFLLLSLLTNAGNLWADGISPVDALRRDWRERIRTSLGVSPAAPAPPPPSLVDAAAAVAPPEVLAGAHGGVVRRAVADGAQIRDIISKLSPVEREMLPDVAPTIDGLVERVASLAVTLHRLDADVSGTSLGALDERIALAERDTRDAEHDRRLVLLRRQRSTLHDLLERRRTLLDQMESASLTLQNLKFDLLKLRSAGVGSALEDVTSATREARALSRDIGHLLDAADDVRKL